MTTADISQAALEDTLAVIQAMYCGRGDALALKPNKLLIQPRLYRLARKVLRCGVHYTQMKRWKHLVKRGARK